MGSSTTKQTINRIRSEHWIASPIQVQANGSTKIYIYIIYIYVPAKKTNDLVDVSQDLSTGLHWMKSTSQVSSNSLDDLLWSIPIEWLIITHVLPPGLFVVHDTGRSGEDDLTEWTGREQLGDPVLDWRAKRLWFRGQWWFGMLFWVERKIITHWSQRRRWIEVRWHRSC